MDREGGSKPRMLAEAPSWGSLGAGRAQIALPQGKEESPSCGGTAKDQYLRTELRSLCAGSFWFYAALASGRGPGAAVYNEFIVRQIIACGTLVKLEAAQGLEFIVKK